MKRVEIFTDGACSGNPGPGGWGAILRYNGKEKELSGGERETTNNRMELTAVIEAVKALKEPCEAVITSDSSYVCKAFLEGWIFNWIKKGWKKSSNKEIPNTDLWKELLTVLKPHKYSFVWVRGHNGHPENERCDKLATAFAAKYKSEKENNP